MTSSDDPFEQGRLAALQREPASSNPYPEDSDDHALWAEGYDSVTGADEDGELKDDE
jgi:hypothetical protein